jgi:hypothetical protein
MNPFLKGLVQQQSPFDNQIVERAKASLSLNFMPKLAS